MRKRGNRNKPIVPEARKELNQFKQDLLVREGLIPEGTASQVQSYEVAKELGIPMEHGDNGDMTTKNAGKIGGQIGGKMVKELVKMAQEQLAKENKLQ